MPMQTLLKEIIPVISTPADITVNMVSTVFEDNNGALLLATNRKVTSRTKHFNIKYHFFIVLTKETLLLRRLPQKNRELTS